MGVNVTLARESLKAEGTVLMLTMNNEAKLKEFINSSIEKQFKQLEEKLDKKIQDISVGIAEAVVQSLNSSRDVHQKISSRIQKWKKEN